MGICPAAARRVRAFSARTWANMAEVNESTPSVGKSSLTLSILSLTFCVTSELL